MANKKRLKQQRSNLARTAIALLDLPKSIKFDLGVDGVENCVSGENIAPIDARATIKNNEQLTACFGGLGPHVLNNAHHYGNADWWTYIRATYGDLDIHVEDVLFTDQHASSKYTAKDHAAKVLYILESGDDFNLAKVSKKNIYTKLTKDELYDRLNDFVLQ